MVEVSLSKKFNMNYLIYACIFLLLINFISSKMRKMHNVTSTNNYIV